MDYYVAGTQAKQVVDTEAGNILLDYIDRYYYDQTLKDDSEYFSKSFSDAADRMMTVTKSPWIPVFIVLGVGLVLVVGFFWWSNAKKQKDLEAKRTEELLKTPLEKFGDTEAEELARKYEEEDKGQIEMKDESKDGDTEKP
jgi:regulatory protein YycI of two-component signal transduction system YycFG